MIVTNWSEYENFSKAEFDCKHTGKNRMRVEFMAALQNLRIEYAAPMYITSGYRSPSHPVEMAKRKAGEHTFGLAADIACYGPMAVRLIEMAPKYGFKRIGVQQKGPHSSRFVHLGMATSDYGFSSPDIWSY